MNRVTNQLVNQIAFALNVTDKPLLKNNAEYRLLVFKEKNNEKWVLTFIPAFIPVEDLIVAVNECYGLFLDGRKTPCGMEFFCAEEPQMLIELAEEWYYETNESNITCI